MTGYQIEKRFSFLRQAWRNFIDALVEDSARDIIVSYLAMEDFIKNLEREIKESE